MFIIFPDNRKTYKFTLDRGKASDIIRHGLALYDKYKIIKSLSPLSEPAPWFMSCFDKAFNRLNNTRQFDLLLIYFDELKLQATRVYPDSQLTGHGFATGLLHTFKNFHQNLSYLKNFWKYLWTANMLLGKYEN